MYLVFCTLKKLNGPKSIMNATSDIRYASRRFMVWSGQQGSLSSKSSEILAADEFLVLSEKNEYLLSLWIVLGYNKYLAYQITSRSVFATAAE